jgi:hypothetical protein
MDLRSSLLSPSAFCYGIISRNHHRLCAARDTVGVQVAIGGDGQVTLGHVVVKGTARKVRKLHRDQVLAGFAGATADAFTLFERFEAKLEKHQGHLVRAAIELTRDWRTDRVLRRLEAMLAVADRTAQPDHHRQRRCAGARARHGGYRFGRRLCPGGARH